jgi:hypothetical protein
MAGNRVWQIPRPPAGPTTREYADWRARWGALYDHLLPGVDPLFGPGAEATTDQLVDALYYGIRGRGTPIATTIRQYNETQKATNLSFYGFGPEGIWAPEGIAAQWVLDKMRPVKVPGVTEGSATESSLEKMTRDALAQVVETWMPRAASPYVSWEAIQHEAGNAFTLGPYAAALAITEDTRNRIGAFLHKTGVTFIRRYLIFLGTREVANLARVLLLQATAARAGQILNSLKSQGLVYKVVEATRIPGASGWLIRNIPAIHQFLSTVNAGAKSVIGVLRMPDRWALRTTVEIGLGAVRDAWGAAGALIGKGPLVGQPMSEASALARAIAHALEGPLRIATNTARAIAQPLFTRFGFMDLKSSLQVSFEAVAEGMREAKNIGFLAPGAAATGAALAGMATVAGPALAVAALALAAGGLGVLVGWLITKLLPDADPKDLPGVAGGHLPEIPPESPVMLLEPEARATAELLAPRVAALGTLRKEAERVVAEGADAGGVRFALDREIAVVRGLSAPDPITDGVVASAKQYILTELEAISGSLPQRVGAALDEPADETVEPELERYVDIVLSDERVLALLMPYIEERVAEMSEEQITAMPDDELEALVSAAANEMIAANDPALEQVAADAVSSFVQFVAVPENPEAEEEMVPPEIVSVMAALAALEQELSGDSPSLNRVDEALATLEAGIVDLPVEVQPIAREALVTYAGIRALYTLQAEGATSGE